MTGLIVRDLVKEIFASNNPEEYIKDISPQNLYLGVKRIGIDSAGDIISISTPEQIQLLLDFDLWNKDQFQEENFWNWLAITDQQGDLSLLNKIFRSLDLKIVALIMSKYVEAYTFDETTDAPPGPDFYTPDKGNTWLRIVIDDKDKEFYLGRLLALIFDGNPDLFYQILSIPSIATPAILEEESYQEANKRLIAEGIPEAELAFQTHASISDLEISELLSSENNSTFRDLNSLDIITWEKNELFYFGQLSEVNNFEIEQSLSFIFNCAIVRFSIEIQDSTAVVELSSKIKGAINLGLELLTTKYGLEIKELYSRLGLPVIYRYGLTKILALKHYVKNQEKIEAAVHNPKVFSVIAGIREPFPVYPSFLKADEIMKNDGVLEPGFKDFTQNSEIQEIKQILSEYFA